MKKPDFINMAVCLSLLCGCGSIYASEDLQNNIQQSKDLVNLTTITLQNDENNVIPVNYEKLKGGVKTSKEEGYVKGWLNADYATGNWLGARSFLEDHGLSFELGYTSDTFQKFRGGINHKEAFRHIGLIDMAANIDTKKLGLWSGGRFHVHAQHKYGHSLTERDINDFQYFSNIDIPERPHMMQLSEYWYEQGIFSDRIKVKLGKQDAYDDIGNLPAAADYLNSSFGTIPVIPVPVYPDPAIGILTSVSPFNWFTFKTGVYDGSAKGGTSGFDTAFDGNGNVVIVLESDFNYSVKNHPGTLQLGYFYHSAGSEEIVSDDRYSIGDYRSYESNYGLYGQFEQMINKEKNDPQTNQGLRILGQIGWSPDDRNGVSRYYGYGLSYTGLFPKRDNDIVGIGSAMADYSHHQKLVNKSTYETAYEIFYKLQLTSWLALQPDFQWIINPAGVGKNAVVFGIRTLFSF